MRSDWWESLNRYVDSCRGRTIDWDTFDCCQFICEAVRAMTDIDPYKEFGIKYSTKSEAIRAIAKYSGTTDFDKGIYSIVTTIGQQTGGTVLQGRPKRGDIVIVDVEKEHICGVSMGSHIALIHEVHGLILYPVKKCTIKTIVRY